jgi:hypothetical protein
VHTPAPTALPIPTFADRFWGQAEPVGPDIGEIPEPMRSVMIVRQFLAVLDKLDLGPRRAAPALVAMLRHAELEGDLSYASPEQVRGEILDTRSVVFSLGVVLFERLTGRHPFGAENNRPRRIDRIRRGELGSGVNSFPTVAAGLRSVLVRAMSPFPEERWPDLRQVREILAQFVAAESPPPRLPGTESERSEDTRAVRMATDFGRELMDAVAKHDQKVTPIGRAPTQRIVVPTASVNAVTGSTSPARRAPQGTPRGGVVTLRPRTSPPPIPEPTSDSVITRIHEGRVDALAETVVVDPADLPAPPPRIVVEEAPPPPPPLPPEIPTILLTPPRAPSPLLLAPLPPPASRRTALIAIISAAVGAGVAIALVVGLRSAPSGAAATSASPEPAPAVVEETPPPSPPPSSAAAGSLPAAEPPPAPAPAPARSDLAPMEQALVSAVIPCLVGSDQLRITGFSIYFHDATVKRTFFGSDGVLSSAERGCIKDALAGKLVPDAPAEGDITYKVKIDPASGLRITSR